MLTKYYVYILTNEYNTSLYIGVTNNLIRRIYEHRNELLKGFTSKYKLKKLVYYEILNDPYSAISREKQLKNWHSDWKWNLVKGFNPGLKDLYSNIVGDPETSSG